MNKPITYNQLQLLIIRQGIIPATNIKPYADFRINLRYATSDLRELARLIDQQLHVRLTLEQADELTTLRETVALLNRIQQRKPAPVLR